MGILFSKVNTNLSMLYHHLEELWDMDITKKTSCWFVKTKH